MTLKVFLISPCDEMHFFILSLFLCGKSSLKHKQNGSPTERKGRREGSILFKEQRYLNNDQNICERTLKAYF